MACMGFYCFGGLHTSAKQSVRKVEVAVHGSHGAFVEEAALWFNQASHGLV